MASAMLAASIRNSNIGNLRTGSPQQVKDAADFFGLSYNSKDGQIVHGLQTVLIGADGKVLKVYSGNDWKPEDVAVDITAAIPGRG